ncbi:PAS domain S-box protein [Syntrophotalea acetylenivorans]|uniref:PAS domain S-box protein n=1 Tax=Syntrophotalea acetylenivorans TaxID=1842532 RepID=UPI001F3EAD22|nr:PAS domain S-box protein [Syntrophotalea acetylenivorans]
MFRSSLGGKLLGVNSACARMHKYASPQEMIAEVNRTGIAKALYAHDGRREELLHRVLHSRDWQICEESFFCKDGSIIDTLFHLRAVRDAEGRPFELEGFVEDITERKRTERALEFTQFAIKNAADQVLWVDNQGRFVYVNDAACYSLGCSQIELTGMSVFDIDPDCSPEVFRQRWQEIKRHCSATFERRHQTRDGHIFPVEIRANYLVYEGQEYLCLFATDISERKRAERALKFTQFAIDKSKDMAFWVTDDGHFFYVNDATCRTLGYSQEELLQMSISDIDPVFTAEVLVEHWRELKEKGSLTLETLHRAKGGRTYPVEVRANYLEVDGKGYNCAFVVDISERKEQEQLLRLTQFAIDNTVDQAFWLTPKGRIIYVNEAACAALGYSREELIGMSIPDIDPDFGFEGLAEGWETLKAKGSISLEGRHKAKDGRIYPVEIRSNYVNFDGKEYSCSFATDISERKANEEKLRSANDLLRAIIEAAPTAIVGLDLGGKVCHVWNPAAEKMLGWSADEIMGHPLPSVPEADQVEFRRLREWVESGQSLDGVEVCRQRKDGTPIDYSIYASPLKDGGGGIIGNIAVLLDITERKEKEQALHLTQFAIDNTIDQAFWRTPDGRIIYVNEAASAALGYTRDELMGMTIPDIDPDFSLERLSAAWETLKAEGSLHFESRHRAKDGRIYPVEVRTNYVNCDGNEFSCSFVTDISERKATEQALRQASLIVENSPAVLFRWRNAEGWPVEMVTGNVTQFGYSQEELLSGSVPFVDLVHPEDLDRVAAEVQEYIASGEDRFGQEYRIVTKQGEVRWIDDRTVAERDAEGRVTHLQGVVMDISDRKRAEEALRESERRYRSIVEHAPFGITHSTNDGKLLNVNPALASILKYDSAQELMETINRSSIQEELFPEPSEREPLVGKILNTESWTVYNNRLLCKDGSMVTCRVHSRRIMDEDGQARGFESYQENITDQLAAEEALRESEEKFRVLAETSPVAICTYNGEHISYANPAMERLFGYSAEELCRMHFWDWAHADFKELIRSRGLDRMDGEAVPGQYEAKYVTKQGEELYILVSAGVMKNQTNVAGVASFLDITERKRTEGVIRASLEEKEVLLREIHHRVKNNLQVVSSLLYLQSQKLSDPELQSHFLESQSRICSMALAHELLYQSKSLAEISLKDYVESLVSQLRQVFQGPEQQIECRSVIGDISLDIAQVIPCGLLITELLSNAYKHAFTDGSNGTIIVSMMKSGRQLSLSVADDGVGLPADLDCRHTATLGLQLVTALTNQLNGTLEVKRDGGTLFRVTFASEVASAQQRTHQDSERLV